MKLSIVLVAVLVVAASATNLRFKTSKLPVEVSKTVAGALATIKSALAKNKERQTLVASTCSTEIAATQKWIDEGHGIDNKDRIEAKKGLAAALGSRIDGLTKFLGKLKSIRKNLRSHIIRVNTAFGTKYQENDNAMNAAKSAVDPQGGLKLLKLPALDAETAADTQQMQAAATTFLELDAHKSQISELSQKLYEVAQANSAETRANIEKERDTLGAFRDALRALILKREAKLAKLTAQLTAINKALESNESFMKDVWPFLEKHMVTTKASCEMMTASFAAAEKSEADVISAIESGPAGGPADPAATPDPITAGGLAPIAP